MRRIKRRSRSGGPFCAVSYGYEVTTADEQGEVGNMMDADK